MKKTFKITFNTKRPIKLEDSSMTAMAPDMNNYVAYCFVREVDVIKDFYDWFDKNRHKGYCFNNLEPDITKIEAVDAYLICKSI